MVAHVELARDADIAVRDAGVAQETGGLLDDGREYEGEPLGIEILDEHPLRAGQLERERADQSPSADITPAPIGKIGRGVLSLRAIASACTGPEPPNASIVQ